MKRILGTFSLFFSTFAIALAVIASVILISDYDKTQDGAAFDLENGSFTVMGNEYVIDTNALNISERLLDFNENIFGKGGLYALKQAFFSVVSVCTDSARLVFNITGSAISASAD